MKLINALRLAFITIKNYIDTTLPLKLDIHQGVANSGKIMGVDEEGNLVPVDNNIDLSGLETKTDAQVKLDEAIAYTDEQIESHTHSFDKLEDKPFYDSRNSVELFNGSIISRYEESYYNCYIADMTELNEYSDKGIRFEVTYDGVKYCGESFNLMARMSGGSDMKIATAFGDGEKIKDVMSNMVGEDMEIWIDGNPNDDYPFCLYFSGGFITNDTEPTEHTAEIYLIEGTIKQLDEKFIPDSVSRADHVHSYNDLTDKTHYDNTEYVESFNETFTAVYDGNDEIGDITYYISNNYTKVNENQKIRCTIDGHEYILEPCQIYAIFGETHMPFGNPVFGNVDKYFEMIKKGASAYSPYIVGSGNSTCNFCILTSDGDMPVNICFFDETEDTEHSVKIELINGELKQLDEKFISDSISNVTTYVDEQIENHAHSWNDLADRPFYENIINITKTIAWDGNTDGLENFIDVFYKVSDNVANDINDYNGCTIHVYNYSKTTEEESIEDIILDIDSMVQNPEDNVYTLANMIVVCLEDGEVEGVSLTKGVYFVCSEGDTYKMWVQSLEYTTNSTELKQLDEKFIPSSIAEEAKIYTDEQIENHTHSFDDLEDKPFGNMISPMYVFEFIKDEIVSDKIQSGYFGYTPDNSIEIGREIFESFKNIGIILNKPTTIVEDGIVKLKATFTYNTYGITEDVCELPNCKYQITQVGAAEYTFMILDIQSGNIPICGFAIGFTNGEVSSFRYIMTNFWANGAWDTMYEFTGTYQNYGCLNNVWMGKNYKFEAIITPVKKLERKYLDIPTAEQATNTFNMKKVAIYGDALYSQYPPKASSSVYGLVKPVSKTSAMTKEVGVSGGKLYTAPDIDFTPTADDNGKFLRIVDGKIVMENYNPSAEIKAYADQVKSDILGGAPKETLDTIMELATAFEENKDVVDALNEAIVNKADVGHVHSYNDLTDKTHYDTREYVELLNGSFTVGNIRDGVGSLYEGDKLVNLMFNEIEWDESSRLKVIYNGEEFNVSVKSVAGAYATINGFGNMWLAYKMMSSGFNEEPENTGEPFMFMGEIGDNFLVIAVDENENGKEVQLAVYIEQGELKILDEKFIPDSVKTQPDWNVNDITSAAYVKNRPFYANDFSFRDRFVPSAYEKVDNNLLKVISSNSKIKEIKNKTGIDINVPTDDFVLGKKLDIIITNEKQEEKVVSIDKPYYIVGVTDNGYPYLRFCHKNKMPIYEYRIEENDLVYHYVYNSFAVGAFYSYGISSSEWGYNPSTGVWLGTEYVFEFTVESVVKLDEKYIPEIISRTGHTHLWNDLEDKPFDKYSFDELDCVYDPNNANNIVNTNGEKIWYLGDPTYGNESVHYITDSNGRIYKVPFNKVASYLYKATFNLTGGNEITIYNILLASGGTIDGITFSSGGTYATTPLFDDGIFITKIEYAYYDTLCENYIPDSIARTVDVDEKIAALPQSDWNVNDESSAAYIKNRPFYTTDPQPVEVANGTYEFTVATNGIYGTTINYNYNKYNLIANDEITIVYDGITYNNLILKEVIVNYSGMQMPIGLYVGNILLLSELYSGNFSLVNEIVDTGESFAILLSDVNMLLATKDTASTHDITIITNAIVDITIPQKYLGFPVWAGEGVNSIVIGNENNIATGEYAHAEGSDTTASGSRSHAEGGSTTATGDYSHSEGYNTTATGDYSHAEGGLTKVVGWYAHAEGHYTIASGNCQHVQGQFNIEDTEKNRYAHIVGNGKSGTKRSNAHTLDWDGNAWYQGSVEATAIILKSPNGTRFSITVGDDGVLSATEITA